MMKRWMAVLGIVFLWSPVVRAEDPVYFADANLKVMVEDKLGKTNPTPTDMLDLTFLGCTRRDIADLTGLEYATNLQTLDSAYNRISDLTPLAGLTNLTKLDLNWNQISDISPLVGLTNLSQLFLHSNPLNQAACNLYIPKIRENNPGITILYDPCVEAAVPRVVGMTQAEAEAALIAAGFKVGTIWWGPSELREGTVFAQNPAGGAMASPGSAVDLTVAQAGSGPLVPGAGCLIAHWKLDETSGEIAFDSASQNDGVTYGQPLWQPAGGRIGGALQFDGVNDYAELPIGPVIGTLTDSTFATWVNWSGGRDGQRIFDFGGGPINMFLTPCAGGIGRMCFAITKAGARSQDQATAPQALAAGWHHVAVTIDAADQTYLLYLDGQVVATKTEAQYTPSSLGETTQNWLGRSRSSADPYFQGALDDFRIYGCVLSAAEVAQLTAEVPPDPSLLAWWKLDETWGSIALDSSGRDYHGTLLGGPLWQPAGGQLGGALQFDGVDDYAQLPIGSLIGSLTDSTFATWVDWSGTGGHWQRVFDFGSTASVNMFFTPCNSQTGSMRFAITNAGESGQDRVTAAQALGTGWHHVAVTIDAARQTYLLYVDGRVAGGKTAGQYTPSSLGDTTRNWLGRSQWSVDPYFHGSLDDFRIYGRVLSGAEIAQLTPQAAGDLSLLAHWRLDETDGEVVCDSAGQNDGVTYGQPLWQPAGGQLGGALQFDGVNDYAQLPIGSVIDSLTDSTFATWVNWSGTGGNWQRVFDFGSTTGVNMFFTPRDGQTGSMRFAITNAGESGQDRVTAAQALGTGWHHVAVTIDAARQTYLLYVDGQVVATKTAGQYTPSSLGHTTRNWLGRSQWSADPYFHGSLDDFRIYSRVLNAPEIQQCMLGAIVR
jgi:hypothetical protein